MTWKELTEKWKNGTLPDGLYYVKENDDIRISPCYRYYLLSVLKDCEVLAPVPTYDQFIDVNKKIEALKQQLTEANKILFNVWNCKEDREHYAELAKSFFEKYGVEK